MVKAAGIGLTWDEVVIWWFNVVQHYFCGHNIYCQPQAPLCLPGKLVHCSFEATSRVPLKVLE